MITLEEFKKYVSITADTLDDELTKIVNSAIASVESECNRKFLETEFTEIYTGNGRAWLYLRNYPIVSVQKIEVSEGSGWEEYERTSIVIDENKIFYEDKTVFPFDSKVRVTYTAGYESVPEDLKSVCLERAKILFDHSGLEGAKNNLGVQSQVEGGLVGITTSYKAPDHSSVIDKYRRVLI